MQWFFAASRDPQLKVWIYSKESIEKQAELAGEAVEPAGRFEQGRISTGRSNNPKRDVFDFSWSTCYSYLIERCGKRYDR